MQRLRCWRAPRWAPLWLRRAFPGCWTQEEIDEIKREAHERWLEMQQWIEPEPETGYDGDDLYGADPTCQHEVVDAPGGGVKCTKCPGWFCY